jgi:FkbM family methyltransferase
MRGADPSRETYLRACSLVGQGQAGLTEALGLLLGLLPRISEPHRRGIINQQIWHCERALERHPMFFSQSGQDSWLEANVFRGKRGGSFAEIGGYDGVSGSNCLYFELMRGWSGLLAEPVPALHAQAAAVRRCPCLRVAVAGEEGEAAFLEIQAGFTQMGGIVATFDPATRKTVEGNPMHKGAVIRVPTRPLASLLDGHGLTEIDYISLDVEGGELSVLATFPFEKYRVTAWTIENNSRGGEIRELMQAKGYRMAEVIGVDEVYLLAMP